MPGFTLGDPREQASLGGNPAAQAAPSWNAPRSQSSDHVVAATPQTGFQPDSGLPAYLDRLMEPYVQKKQAEAFASGYVAQTRAGAEVNVIDDDKGLIPQLFGPNNWQQGALHARAVAMAQNTVQGWMNDPDLLKLDDNALGKKLGDDMDGLKTGNNWTDEALNTELVKHLPQTVQLITQKRIGEQQRAAGDNYEQSVYSTVSTYDDYMRQRVNGAGGAAGTQPPDEQALRNLLGVFSAKPQGMFDETQQKRIKSVLFATARDGKTFAMAAMRKYGLLNALGEDERAKLEDIFQASEKKALQVGAVAHVADIAALDRRMELAKSPDWKPTEGDPHPITPAEYVNGKLAVNDRLKTETGADMDFYQYDDIMSGVDRLISARGEADRAKGNRVYTEAQKQRDAEERARDSVLAYKGGRAWQEVAAGRADANAVEVAANNDAINGEFGSIVANFKNNHEVYTQVRKTLTAPIANSVGKGYTDDIDKARQMFDGLNNISPGAAREYYGDDYSRMMTLSGLVSSKTMPPAAAWMHVFGDTLTGLTHKLDPSTRKEAEQSVTDWMGKNAPSPLMGVTGLGPKGWNGSAERAVKMAVTDGVAELQGNTSFSKDQLAGEAAMGAQARGILEGYGPFMWLQAPGSTPLWKKAGIPRDTMNGVFYREVDDRLRMAGFSTGAHGDEYDILRQPGLNGKETVMVFAGDGHGKTYTTSFTTDDLRNRANTEAKKTIENREWLRNQVMGKPDFDYHEAFYGNMRRAVRDEGPSDGTPAISIGVQPQSQAGQQGKRPARLSVRVRPDVARKTKNLLIGIGEGLKAEN